MNCKHKLSKTREYYVWATMWSRCRNAKVPAYIRYGGKGVRVCSRWKSFTAFLKDLGPCPPGHTLERRQNEAGYTPENCYWATRKAQALNRKSTHWLTYKGTTLCATDWARKLNLPKNTIFSRLGLGWSVKRILTTPRKNEQSETADHPV